MHYAHSISTVPFRKLTNFKNEIKLGWARLVLHRSMGTFDNHALVIKVLTSPFFYDLLFESCQSFQDLSFHLLRKLGRDELLSSSTLLIVQDYSKYNSKPNLLLITEFAYKYLGMVCE